MPLPKTGRSGPQVFADLEAASGRDLNWRSGGTFAYTYHGGDDVEAVAKHAYMRFLTENALDPTVYPSLLKFENDIVEIARAHLGGGAEAAGSFTSGGTESCMLSVKTARDFARATRPEIVEPEVILPATAHAAFHKACHYFHVKPVIVPVDTRSFRADPQAIRAAISPRTILIVASAPSYAHGVLDPIEAIGAIAREHDILFHVDACIGGFLLPFFRKLGRAIPPFDLSVAGVTSISMDFHKYAYCPKGASVVLYKSAELRRHQIFACSSWTGYSIVNTTMQSSKSGGPVAACWAVLNYLGEDGYLNLARRTLEATNIILRGLNSIPELRVLGAPDSSLIAFASDEVNVFSIIDEMRARKWYVQPQLSFMGSPKNVHLTVRHDNLEGAPQMIEDLKASVAAAKAKGRPKIPADLRIAASQLTPEGFTLARFQGMMAQAGGEGTAPLNEILDALQPAVRELALVHFMSHLYRPRDSATS